MDEQNSKIQVDTKNDNLNVLGLNFQISNLVGDTIVANYLEQLSEEDLQIIYDGISSVLFNITYDKTYDTESQEYIKTEEKKLYLEREVVDRNSWSAHGTHMEYTPLCSAINEAIKDQMSKDVLEKTQEIINSDTYKERVEKISNEIVDYITNGYVEDVKSALYRKLVGDTINPGNPYNNPNVCGISLRNAIQEEIMRTISHH